MSEVETGKLPGLVALKAIVKTLRRAAPEAEDEQLGEQIAHALQAAFHGSTEPWLQLARGPLKLRLEDLTGTPWTYRIEWNDWPWGPRLETTIPLGDVRHQLVVSPGWGKTLVVLARPRGGEEWTFYRKWDTAYEVERGDIDCMAIGDPFEVALMIDSELVTEALRDMGFERGNGEAGEA